MSDNATEKLFDKVLGEMAAEHRQKKRESELSEPTGDLTGLLLGIYLRRQTMDKTNRVVRIIRRMAEIEELRANGDLPSRIDEELSDEYCQLEEELDGIEPAQ